VKSRVGPEMKQDLLLFSWSWRPWVAVDCWRPGSEEWLDDRRTRGVAELREETSQRGAIPVGARGGLGVNREIAGSSSLERLESPQSRIRVSAGFMAGELGVNIVCRQGGGFWRTCQLWRSAAAGRCRCGGTRAEERVHNHHPPNNSRRSGGAETERRRGEARGCGAEEHLLGGRGRRREERLASPGSCVLYRALGFVGLGWGGRMAHGGYAGRRVAEGRPVGRRPKVLRAENKSSKQKSNSLKKQIRSTERFLRKNLPPEVRKAQEKKLEQLKQQQETEIRLAIERKTFLRDRKKKFFERRKIERLIRRLEKQQRTSTAHITEENISNQLSKLKEDLEYVRFFPKTEKYVPLFIGGDDTLIVEKRNKLRKQIKANLIAAAAGGKDLEETGSEDDGLLDTSDDDFFLNGSSSDEVDADDEWTDKSTREPASSASGKAASGMSSDEKNQRQVSARALMPPPRPFKHSSKYSGHGSRSMSSSSRRNQSFGKMELSTTSSNTSNSRSGPSKNWGSSSARADNSSNLSSNSDARKPRRKRRPKKKKQV
ncbi:hypothetical protein Taro_025145, partial [Colocasia esculenta]|nr:hypothetical protein [Colocasia esculenta]